MYNATVEEMLMKKAGEKKQPISGVIELLPLCNMKCDMCYVRLSNEEMEKQGRLITIDEWLELAGEMKRAGVLFLLLTGGEPLVYPKFAELYLELLKMGFIITINSNGTLINEEWAEFFGKNKPRRINITLYGTSEKEYSELCHYPCGFEKTICAIRLLKKNCVDVKINGSITSANQSSIEDIMKISNELDIPVEIATYMIPAVRERDREYNLQARMEPSEAAEARIRVIQAKQKEYKKYVSRLLWERDHLIEGELVPGHMTCTAGNCSFAINWQGNMRPCVMMPQPSISVLDVEFEEAWVCLKKEVQKIFLNPKCSACKMRLMCRTCAACAYWETGEFGGVSEYLCKYTEETYKILESHLEKRAQ